MTILHIRSGRTLIFALGFIFANCGNDRQSPRALPGNDAVASSDASQDASQHDSAAGALEAGIGCGVVSLYDFEGAAPTQPFLTGTDLIIATTTSVVDVSVVSRVPRRLTSATSLSMAVVLDGGVYFKGAVPVAGANPDAAGPVASEAHVFMVPLVGGSPTEYPALGEASPVAADDTSIYLESAGRVVRWTPKTGNTVSLPIDVGWVVDGVSLQGDYLYLAAQDARLSGFTNGLIARIPRDGSGAVATIVTGIGHPWSLTADAAGLYWSEDPPTLAGAGRIARSALDGTSVVTVVGTNASSLAVAGEHLIFTVGGDVDAVLTTGGAVTVLASDQQAPGFITAVGDKVVWLAPATSSFSTVQSPSVMMTCFPPRP